MISIENTVDQIEKNMPDVDTDKIRTAYDYVSQIYGERRRKNGCLYVQHFLQVVTLLADFPVEEDVLLAAMLHHISVDGDVERLFGKEVCSLISSVYRLSHIYIKRTDRNMDKLSDMLSSMTKDIRVVLIVLADRVDNMRSIAKMPEQERLFFSQETLDVYAPIASRLGMYAFKKPLEDISFSYLHPEECHKLQSQMKKHKKYRDKVVAEAISSTENILEQHSISGKVSGRLKHMYAIFCKLKKKQKNIVEDIHDIFAIRILVPTVADCYRVLGVVHEHYIPIRKRFKDYIAVPKPNGYQSLHTTVLGLFDHVRHTFPVEVQIRTQQMHDDARYGRSSHWHYKQNGSDVPFDDFSWQEGDFEADKGTTGRHSFFQRVYAVTPQGDIINLPEGATPIDFAFAIHSDIGYHLQFAKVNGTLAPLSYTIQNGDIIEIITSRSSSPNINWLSLSVSNKAKSHIRTYFSRENIDEYVRKGRDILNSELMSHGYAELDQSLSVLKMYQGRKRNRQEREDLLLRVGNKSLLAKNIFRDIEERVYHKTSQKTLQKISSSKAPLTESSHIVIGENWNVTTRIAQCCSPKKGDAIVGFVTRGSTVTIHRQDCSSLRRLDYRRFLEARYEGDEQEVTRKTTLEICRGMDRVGIVQDIVRLFTHNNWNVVDFHFEDRSAFFAKIIFVVQVPKLEDVSRKIQDLVSIPSVQSAREILEK